MSPAPAGPLLLVTRPEPQASDWVRRLQALGLRARALPLLAVGPAPDPAPLRAARQALVPGALVMFVSPNAVLQSAAAGFFDGAWPDGVRAGATGPGTVRALRDQGVAAEAIVAPAADAAAFDSEHLWQQLSREDWRGRPVWIVRGEGGRDWFADTARAAGAQVQLVQGYARGAARWTPEQQQGLADALAAPQAHCWLFSSSEGLEYLAAAAPGADWSRSRGLVTHPRIAAAAQLLGLGEVQLIGVGVEAVAQALAQGRSIQSTPNGEP
ncbi:uroporphyrinogen-III synthase [Ideonella sp. 4Y11]|uniref:Uroporphyrinogen-III synthase n=1 Tax=Ideonella aquatica TaxID=2824119 RepID=A0A940YFA9_9BURK|nr:uroporphyrinogen-III synthase [Ideonella aquatica]MBQ0957692.1 uroporphyrinogen-III synthase [Ideonella aquatica]